MTAEVKVGKFYAGRVVSIKDFGAFVEIAPETDGLCHVSELSDKYVERVTDVINMGDEVRVKVILVDDQGRIKLSRKAAMREEGLSDPDPVGAGVRVGETISSAARLLAPASEPLSPLMTKRSLSVQFHTLTVPLAEMKSAGRRAGGKLNDAFVAGIASGWRRYHDHHGAPASALRMSMPINVRTAATENVAGNQFAPARFPVPLTVVDPGLLEQTRNRDPSVPATGIRPQMPLAAGFVTAVVLVVVVAVATWDTWLPQVDRWIAP